jgi:protein-disulfide isomerase
MERVRKHAGTLYALYEQSELREIPIRPDDPVKHPDAEDGVLVIITDFQCPHCARFAKYTDDVLVPMFGDRLKIVFKHYPASTGCNPYIPRNMHPFACVASSAAEAARVLGGNDAFWKAHDLMFASRSRLGDAKRFYPELARKLGFEWEAFQKTMTSDAVLDRIREDVELAKQIKMRGTPSVYLNGRKVPTMCRQVDVFWQEVKRRMTGKVWALYEKNPKRRLALRPDDPSSAVDAGTRALPVVFFGDFADERSQALATFLATGVRPLFRGQLRVIHKYLPDGAECNPYASGDAVPSACVAARAAEAARVLGGDEAFWKAHDILYKARKFNLLEKMDYAKVAENLNLDAEQYLATMESDAVRKRIGEDVELARSLNVKKAPAAFVSNRQVPSTILFDRGFWDEAARRYKAIVEYQARQKKPAGQSADSDLHDEATEDSPDP